MSTKKTSYFVPPAIILSRDVRKPDFCICENKDADQLRGNREADQRLCFRHLDSTTPLLSKSKISSLKPHSVIAQPGLCGTWSETPKTGFLTSRLIYRTRSYQSRVRYAHLILVHASTSTSFYMKLSHDFGSTIPARPSGSIDQIDK